MRQLRAVHYAIQSGQLIAGQRAGGGLHSRRERLAALHGAALTFALANTIGHGATATSEAPYAPT